MIGLQSLQADVYRAAVEIIGERGYAARAEDIGRRKRRRPSQLHRPIARCAHFGFVRVDRSGHVTPNRPPHDVVLHAVCRRNGITLEQMRGPDKSIVLVRARRIVAKTLHADFHYSHRVIGIVLGRHPSSVEDYLDSERAVRRSKARSIQLYGERRAA